MKRLILYSILSLCLFQQAISQVVEKEGLSFYSHKLSRCVSYSVILPDGYYSSTGSYPVLYLFHGIGGDASSWLEYGNLARVMDRMVKEEDLTPFIMVMPDGYLSYYCDAYDGSFPYEIFFTQEFVPYIDHTYRTLNEPSGRSITGFSMGGFGALSVSLRNRNLFGSVAALSASIRTDKQYSEEMPQEGWDSQWGRIFGAIGKKGTERLTDYYKQCSPYHIFQSLSAKDLDKFGIFLDIGDREETLGISNDELHQLLVQKKIPHHWNVRPGGHDFFCWNAAMPDVFRFLNKQFTTENCPNAVFSEKKYTANIRILRINNVETKLYVPTYADSTCRKYPVIYIQGNIRADVEKKLSERFNTMVEKETTWPAILCFLPDSVSLREAISTVEKATPEIRNSRRMRALISIGKSTSKAAESIRQENMFTDIVWGNTEKDSYSHWEEWITSLNNRIHI